MPGDPGSGSGAGFEALARQYWNAWGDALRSASPGAAQAGAQPWQAALDWWSRAAQGSRVGGNDTFERFNAQAGQWFGQMQQVAAQCGGGQASAAEVAAAWKRAMESAGGNPFADLMRGMRGPGLQGFEQWFEQARPYLDGLRGEALSWLRTPTFGFAREHQERWQQLALAMADYQQCTQAHDALMQKATRDAFAIFEDKLVDAQMRLRGGVQREVEQACALFGMPTRTELDGAHRKIVELERQVRRLRDGIGGAQSRKKVDGDAEAPLAVKKPSSKESVPKKAAARKPAAKKAAARKSATANKQAPAKAVKGKR